MQGISDMRSQRKAEADACRLAEALQVRHPLHTGKQPSDSMPGLWQAAAQDQAARAPESIQSEKMSIIAYDLLSIWKFKILAGTEFILYIYGYCHRRIPVGRSGRRGRSIIPGFTCAK